jgi:hypothetical protein
MGRTQRVKANSGMPVEEEAGIRSPTGHCPKTVPVHNDYQWGKKR